MKNMAKARKPAASATEAQLGSRLRLLSGETGTGGSVKVSTSRGSPSREIDVYLSKSAQKRHAHQGDGCGSKHDQRPTVAGGAAYRQHKANRFAAALRPVSSPSL